MIYQDPLAYLLGLEGIALLDAWAGDHDRAFTDARLAEIRRLLDDDKLRGRGAGSPGEQPDEPLPEPATGIGDWQDWPWSLMDHLPSVARASRGRRPPLVIWHFQRPAA